MKIAVCFSGQPRTWKQCYKSWDNLFSRFVAEIDYFYHLWNFNSLPQADTVIPQYISQEEIYEIEAILKPKKMMIDDYDKNRQVIRDVRELGNHYPHLGGTPVYHTGAQLYSHMQSARLKRQYEIENNFEYDICFKMRTDLIADQASIDNFLRNFKTPQTNTIYSGCIKATKFDFAKVVDLSYYSDSSTFDKLAEFYNFLPSIGNAPFKHDNRDAEIVPEMVFALFIDMCNIDKASAMVGFKIMRSEEYVKVRGRLGEHECS